MFLLLLVTVSSASLNSLLDENEEVKQLWLNTKLNSKCSFNLIVFTNSLKLAIDASRSMMVEIAFFSPREVKLSLRKIITTIITTMNMMNMIMRRRTMRRTILRRKKKMIKRRKILKS